MLSFDFGFYINVTPLTVSFQGKNCPSMYREMYYKGKWVFIQNY